MLKIDENHIRKVKYLKDNWQIGKIIVTQTTSKYMYDYIIYIYMIRLNHIYSCIFLIEKGKNFLLKVY